MIIGNIVVKNFNTNELVFESSICDISIMSGRLYVSLDAGYRKDLELVRNSVYKIEIINIQNQENLNFMAYFEDYAFSASASDYYDQEGVHHSGIVSTNNRLQFGIIGN